MYVGSSQMAPMSGVPVRTSIPQGARIIDVAEYGGVLTVYFVALPNVPWVDMEFFLTRSGGPVPADMEFVGSIPGEWSPRFLFYRKEQ